MVGICGEGRKVRTTEVRGLASVAEDMWREANLMKDRVLAKSAVVSEGEWTVEGVVNCELRH